MKVGFDLDGVLCNFNTSYEPLLARLAGVDPRNYSLLTPENDPDAWDYDKQRYSPAIIKEAWRRIQSSESFWRGLAETDDMQRLREIWPRIHPGHDIYFVTSRPGLMAKYQTEAWLTEHLESSSQRLVTKTPTVLLSAAKGDIAKALSLDIYVDDRPENVQGVLEKSPETTVYLLTRKYNRGVGLDDIRIPNIDRILKQLV